MMRNKFFAYLIAGIAAVLALGSCSSGVSYAELLRDERKATNKFLAYQHVLNEIPSDTIFETGPNAPYYRLDEDGNVYMQVHGGVLMAVIDLVSTTAAYATGKHVITLSSNTNFI